MQQITYCSLEYSPCISCRIILEFCGPFLTEPLQRADELFQIGILDEQSISDPGLLTAIHVERASLVVITTDQSDTALRAVSFLRDLCPQVPVIARARDLEVSARLLDAGATHAYPEAIEASLRLGATALQILHVPTDDIDLLVQGVRDWGYKPVLEEEPGQDKQR